jgi:hypothetical protein
LTSISKVRVKKILVRKPLPVLDLHRSDALSDTVSAVYTKMSDKLVNEHPLIHPYQRLRPDGLAAKEVGLESKNGRN